jgi:hypothetical protein
MAYKFLQTDQGRILLVRDGVVVVSNIERIAGYEQLRLNVIDTAVDSLNEQLKAKGLLVRTVPVLEPEIVNKKVKKADMAEEKETKVIYKDGIGTGITNVFGIIVGMVLFIAWFGGIVLATGWMKLVAVIPFYSWYLCVELLFQRMGWIVTAVN